MIVRWLNRLLLHLLCGRAERGMERSSWMFELFYLFSVFLQMFLFFLQFWPCLKWICRDFCDILSFLHCHDVGYWCLNMVKVSKPEVSICVKKKKNPPESLNPTDLESRNAWYIIFNLQCCAEVLGTESKEEKEKKKKSPAGVLLCTPAHNFSRSLSGRLFLHLGEVTRVLVWI